MTQSKDGPLFEALPVADCEPETPVAVAVVEHESNGIDDDNQNDDESRRMAAGVFGGVLGCCIGGPCLALVSGFGAAHLTKNETVLGDTARAMGDVALYARDKARQVNEKRIRRE